MSKLTGFNFFNFGANWQPSESEKEIARRVLIFLEAKRVLYSPFECEVPSQCVWSIIEIRNFLTDEISNVREDSDLEKYFRVMRSACNKFLTENKNHRSMPHYSGTEEWKFLTALGELRGVFGMIIAQVTTGYGITIEDDLASIIPVELEED